MSKLTRKQKQQNADRVEYGQTAVECGAEDTGDMRDNIVDTIANVLHFAESQGFQMPDREEIVRIALMHCEEELSGMD